MKDENQNIARLIKQIQSGNQSAFKEFYNLTSPKAYFIALKITQNEHDAEDILQESYIKVLEKINEIDTLQNINAWFLRIVSNKSKDLLKSRNRLVFDGEEESVFDEIPEEKAEFCPEENLNQEELRLEVMAAIDELTAEKRACIMMMYFGDMSVKEIAESIEVPESTVKNRLFTARKDLKARFEKNGNVLYGAALGGLLIWALSKTSEITASAFATSAASASVLAGVNAASVTAASSAAAASAATASAVSSSAAATGTGVAAKIAALSVAQKVAAGIAATAVIGGSTAGVATVAKKIASTSETTTYIEEVTTAPSQTEEYVFAVIPEESSTTLPSSTVQITEPTATVKDESTTKRPSATSTTKSAQTTKATSVASTTKQTTTKKETTTKNQTTAKSTTTRPTTTRPTTRPTTTKTATTARPTTTRPTAIESTTVKETTTQPTTTQPTTTQPTTTVLTTQAPATVNVEVVDMNEEVVANLSFTVEADTEMTWEYLVSQIKAKGYEPKAGIYGDAVDAVAESGKTYSITAEL